jgi:hypothetical protein
VPARHRGVGLHGRYCSMGLARRYAVGAGGRLDKADARWTSFWDVEPRSEGARG